MGRINYYYYTVISEVMSMSMQKVNQIIDLLKDLNDYERGGIVIELQEKYGLTYNDGELYTKKELR